MRIPSKAVQDTPSWRKADAAKKAADKAHADKAPQHVKHAALDAYRVAMRKCVREGLI